MVGTPHGRNSNRANIHCKKPFECGYVRLCYVTLRYVRLRKVRLDTLRYVMLGWVRLYSIRKFK